MNILDKLERKGIKTRKDEDVLTNIHHELMKFYKCWIPIDELKKMPIPTVIELLRKIRKDKRKPEPLPVVIMGYAKKSSSGKRLGRR